jgi:energy-coupling factor transport system substrate-specific component
VTGPSSPTAIRVSPRARAALGLSSLVGAVAFAWPFFVAPRSSLGQATVAPVLFGLLLVLVLAVVLAELSEGGLNAKAVAMLGVLSALGAALRPLGAGTAGIETVFFLVILGGRALGPGFGFVLGCTTLFSSALITGGVGPWLPYQMFASAWVGLGAGLLPPVRGRSETAVLVGYAGVSAFLYGFMLNLSFWPFTLGTRTSLSFVPGGALTANLHRYLLFDAATSLGWDTGRAMTSGILIALAGPTVLTALRRASRRAAFDSPVAFDAPVAFGPTPAAGDERRSGRPTRVPRPAARSAGAGR